MYAGKRTLALIPARGGSKGLPRKNLLELAGKPLVTWSVEHALASRYVDRVVVSTDDTEIADVSQAAGAEVPFLRPADLAADDSSSIDVIVHAIEWLEAAGETFDMLALLEPTSPLREPADVDACIALLADRPDAEAVVSVALLEAMHPAFLLSLDDAGFLHSIWGEHGLAHVRRQDLSEAYFLDGTMYVSKVDALLGRRSFYHDATIGYVVPRWKSHEIDDVHDAIAVDAILRHRLREEKP